MAGESSVFTGQIFVVDVAGWPVKLPIMRIRDDFGISLMMVIDMGVRFGAHIGAQLAARLAHLKPDIVVGPATLGIPIAIEVSRALGLDNYVILQKSPKLHLGDALEQKITSITSAGSQRLLLDRHAVPKLLSRRVLLVDDVIATGSSLHGALALLRQAGAVVVGIGTVLTEAYDWEDALGEDTGMVHALAHIPQFRPLEGNWLPIEGTE